MHDKHSRSRSELWLGRQLRDAARREQPEFSESLHRRIMQAVRPTTAEPTAANASLTNPACGDVAPAAEMRIDIPRHRSHWRSAAWLAAAAAVLASVIVVQRFGRPENRGGSQPSQTQSSQPQMSVVHSVAVPESPIAKSDAPKDNIEPDDLASATANYTFDDLSRDAQATAHMLVDQLPFETQAEDWGL